jgi:hypothetical protein
MTAAPLLPEIRIHERADVEETRAFLERDRLLAAYALADLDPSSGDPARWWLAFRGADAVACALLVEVLPFRPCFAWGEPEAVSRIFSEVMTEQRLIVAAPPSCRPAIEAAYRFERCDRMHRMAVDTATFLPRVTHTVVRLGPDQLEDVVDLYGHVSRTYFTAKRLEREIYFGIYAGATLVSAAGTHVRSRDAGLAAVGNVLTRITHRSRGMATSVTSAVTEAALEQHRDVVLNVRQENTTAIAVYQRLGYRVHENFIEGPALRRARWERVATKVFGTRGNA